MLRRRLLDIIAALRPEGKAGEAAAGAWRRHRLLELRYVEALPPAAVQAQLGIVKSQYYREHARALAVLAALLTPESPGHLAPAGAPTEDGAEPRPAYDRPPVPVARRTEDAARPGGGLPRPLTAFFGREREVAAILNLLGRADVPLVTLTGPGGVGKTRLAVEVAAAAAGGFAHGATFVALAPLADPARVASAIALAVGVYGRDGEPLLETLKAWLRAKQVLLVLDNFEHVLDAAQQVADLLERCPGLKVLTTSRAPLRLSGEQQSPVPALTLPDAAAAGHAEEGGRLAALAAAESVRFFVARARAALPVFALSAENAGAVAGICRRLDGLPLALELAAARVRHLPPAALLARLESPPGGLPLLTGGPRDAPPRQRTLRDAIAWSYGLLPPAAQSLFRRLGVFAGGFTLEAAQAVAAADAASGPAPDEVDKVDVLEGISLLVDVSLAEPVAAAPAAGMGGGGGADDACVARYRLLETVREYALERLQEYGELAPARTRHAGYYLALAEAVAPELTGPRQLAWLGRLEAEHDNYRAALRWCQTERESAETGLRLAAALRDFWRYRGRHREGRVWLEAALAHPGAAARTAARAEALCVAGQMARALGDRAAARPRLEASVALWRELGDACGLGRALAQLGLLTTASDASAARALLEEAVALARAAGARPDLALTLRMLGNVEAPRPAAAAGPSALEESATIFRELGDGWGLGVALTGLAGRALQAGDEAAARAYYEEALAHRREVDDTIGLALILNRLGAMARRRGDHRRAAALGEESRALALDLGNSEMVADALTELGFLALATGEPARAGSLLEESLHLRRGREPVAVSYTHLTLPTKA